MIEIRLKCEMNFDASRAMVSSPSHGEIDLVHGKTLDFVPDNLND
jgi:hypothetical protein